MVKAKVFILEKRFKGLPKADDLKIVEEELPALQDGEYLAEAVYLRVDPYMRPASKYLPLGQQMIGQQIAKIIESKNKKYPVGQYVVGQFGWRTHTISNGQPNAAMRVLPEWLIPDLGTLPISLALGVLGMPGNSAYFGFLEICKPKEGETVLVSGAAGAVGSVVGQIAKIKGCTVIGIAGSDEKGKWLKDTLKFDHFINYKTQDIEKVLAEIAPKGIDCYFDNVGGEISSSVLKHMNVFGRVSVCGSISAYNDEILSKASVVQPFLIAKEVKMEGFLVTRWTDRWFEGIEQMKKWIEEGKLTYEETVTNGFENMFDAFVDLFKGGNTGKAIIKV